MRKKGEGSFFSLTTPVRCAAKRMTGQSLYFPRVMMRTLAQVLTEEYSEHGVRGQRGRRRIDSPGTRAMPSVQNRPDLVIQPVKIAEAFWCPAPRTGRAGRVTSSTPFRQTKLLTPLSCDPGQAEGSNPHQCTAIKIARRSITLSQRL